MLGRYCSGGDVRVGENFRGSCDFQARIPLSYKE